MDDFCFESSLKYNCLSILFNDNGIIIDGEAIISKFSLQLEKVKPTTKGIITNDMLKVICHSISFSVILLTVIRSEISANQNAKHLDGIELVNYINKNQSFWRAELHSRFQSLSKDIKKGFYGVKVKQMEKIKQFLRIPAQGNLHIPREFDARSAWPMCHSIGAIRDQSSCGSCWAFGAAEAISDRICISSRGKIRVKISAEDLLSCCHNCGDGCQGGDPFDAWLYWTLNGLVSGGDFITDGGCKPYPFPPCAHHTNKSVLSPCPEKLYPTPVCYNSCIAPTESYVKYYGKSAYIVHPNELSIQTEIMKYGPVEAAFDVYRDFETYSKGIYHHLVGEYLGGHAVKIVGWGEENGEKYWRIANSWNTGWGENGYFRIRRGVNECGIEAYVSAGIPDL